ncbi:hypothetical protein LT679_01910 [Mucilaginibacter roseus]|uniref:Uncharacterized protein n=1 Tax=Mucilaginibacter roseus TaxID=1528868 RepID=A0ABS8U0Q8_9SPHI|nr:hypothetical protein [Mucilaginibacter roseus]MCD8739344.1 hypothetical protein [Mucilaginibacter roseus]
MLDTISWQQYLTAVILLSFAWYAYISITYYRAELLTLLKIKPQTNATTPPVASVTPSVMGQVKHDDATSTVDAQTLLFSESEIPDEVSDQTVPKGPGDDLIAEAETLITAYEDVPDKIEFLSMLKLLIDKYEACFDEMDLPSVAKQIKSFAQSRLPFTVTETEWPSIH